MTATAHALIGASLAAKIANPFLAIPIAIVSHFVADVIPHWDAGTNRRKKTRNRLIGETVVDVILGFILAFLIFGRSVEPMYLFVLIIAAQLPDWLKAPSDTFGIKIPPFSWMETLGHKIQWRMQLPWGLVTQIATVTPMILWGMDLLG